MKNFKIITSIIAMLSLVWSCGEKDNLDPVGNWELTSPVLTSPATGEAIILDETTPTSTLEFAWNEAVSSERYIVQYTFVLDSADNADFNSPILSITPANSGKNTFLKPSFGQIDEALSIAGFQAGSTVNLKWGVIAKSINKETVAAQPIAIKRFVTEIVPSQLYVSGSATEKGTEISQAIPMKALKDKEGNLSNIFELYTSLQEGKTYRFYSAQKDYSHKYGGSDGNLVKNGGAITAPETGQYLITVNFNNNTYELLKIEKWSIVGNVIPGGWGGDSPLTYKGNSVWEGTIDLTAQDNNSGGFIFRANGEWAYQMKRIKGTTNNVLMDSQKADAGVEIEDIPVTNFGKHKITLNLAADQYVYSMQKDESVTPPANTPDKLFLLSGSTVIAELTKNEDKFTSVKYIALQAGTEYMLNSASDGSGTSYTLTGAIGETSTPDNDNVSATLSFGVGTASTSVARDQAFLLTVDFKAASVTWKYYNIKIFHWSDWDARDEFLMTYVHPYTYKYSGALKGGYEMKFNSPWEVELGADNPTALSGTLVNKGGSNNLKAITQDATYNVTLTVSDTYGTGSYEIVKQ